MLAFTLDSSPLLALKVSRVPVGGSAGFSSAGRASLAATLICGCIESTHMPQPQALLQQALAPQCLVYMVQVLYLKAQPERPLKDVRLLFIALALEGHYDNGQGRWAMHLVQWQCDWTSC